MTAITKLSYKTKQVIIVDLSNQKPAEIAKRTEEAQKEIAAMAPKSALIITDVTGVEVANETINAVMEFAKKNTPYVKASTIVADNKMLNLIAYNVGNSAGRKITSFATRAQAMDWLVTQP
jgi:hypothetical protein